MAVQLQDRIGHVCARFHRQRNFFAIALYHFRSKVRLDSEMAMDARLVDGDLPGDIGAAEAVVALLDHQDPGAIKDEVGGSIGGGHEQTIITD